MLVDEAAATAQFGYVNGLIASVTFAILYYDFILTFPSEVERYWKGRLSWASVLFFMNRYITVLSHLPIVYEYFGDLSGVLRRCHQLQLYHGLLASLTQGVVALLLIVRTYALYNCNRKVAVFLATILVIGGGVSTWAISNTMRALSLQDDPSDAARLLQSGCVLVLSKSQGAHYALAWSTILVFDVAVFGLTLARALRQGLAWREGLFYLILRDGTVYFGILIIFYLLNVLTFVLAKPGYQGFLSTLTSVLSSTLVTRMMLNLRDHDGAEVPYSQLSRELRFWNSGLSMESNIASEPM